MEPGELRVGPFRLRRRGELWWEVTSRTEPGTWHNVERRGSRWVCGCTRGMFEAQRSPRRARPCDHHLAVLVARGEAPDPWPDPVERPRVELRAAVGADQLELFG